MPLTVLDKNIAFLCFVTINQNIRHELIAIIELFQYQIINEYNKVLLKNASQHTKNIILTKRQAEILTYLANGYTEEAIGLSMGVSVSTIKYHKQNIFKKLDAACSIEAIIKALQYNIIALNDINKQCI